MDSIDAKSNIVHLPEDFTLPPLTREQFVRLLYQLSTKTTDTWINATIADLARYAYDFDFFAMRGK